MKAWLQLMGEAASSLTPRSKRDRPSSTVVYTPPPPPPPPPKPTSSQPPRQPGTSSGKQPARSTNGYTKKKTEKPKPVKKPINFGFYPPEYERKFKDERIGFRKPRNGWYD